MKSKHRETLPRKHSLETKRRIYSKVNIPFYASPKILREVLFSVLESAKPGTSAITPVVQIMLQIPSHTQPPQKDVQSLGRSLV